MAEGVRESQLKIKHIMQSVGYFKQILDNNGPLNYANGIVVCVMVQHCC